MRFQELGPDIWACDGPVVDGAAGFRFPTRMIVMRRPDCGLVVWSPVALSEDLRRGCADLGRVTDIIAPNRLHHLFVDEWMTAYPDARLWIGAGVATKLPQFADRAVTLSVTPPPAWGDQISYVTLENRIADELVIFHHASGTVIFTDVLQQMPKGWFTGWRAIVAKLDLMTGDRLSVPRKFRWGFTSKIGLRSNLQQILHWDICQIVVAHGPIVSVDAKEVIRRAFDWVRV